MPPQATPAQLRKIIGVANYQFGMHTGRTLFTPKTRIACSRKTGRVRHIYRGHKLLATLRPTDGLLALTLHAANLLISASTVIPNNAVVQTEVSEFIKKGGDVFAKHVVLAPNTLRPSDEVIVTDENCKLLGVGSAVISGNDMMHFRRGVAIRIRRGTDEDNSDSERLRAPEE